MRILVAATIAVAATSGAALAQEPVWDGHKVVLESQELTSGVFAVIPSGADEMATAGYPIATTAGFVVGENGVLVIESMLNQRLTDQLFDLIAAETDKPVRYLVNTSYHGDHSYGNQYVPEDVDLIQHANAAAYIGEHLEADKQFMIQNFGQGRGIEEITHTEADILVAEGGALTVNLGGISVEIKDYGFAQTGGDLFVSVPSAGVLWTGNPIVAQPPALPWLLDGHLIATRNTLQAVHDAFPADTKVVPCHGPLTNMAALQWNVDYLDAVEKEVSAAIAEGLSLEETQGKVAMEDWGGYALFDWVHPGLNIPAAYNDLK